MPLTAVLSDVSGADVWLFETIRALIAASRFDIPGAE